MKTKDLRFTIGDVGIALSGTRLEEYPLPWGYGPFCGCDRPEIQVHVHQSNPGSALGSSIFSCPPVWSLYRNNGTTSVAIFQDSRFPGYARTLTFSNPLDRADLYLHEGTVPSNNLFAGPTMLLLMVNYLAQEKGAMLHACGVHRDGRGMLFVGDSGAGKSTLGRLLDQGEGIEVLSDERMILRRVNGGFHVFGTPWHGDADFASALSARLAGICFLQKGRTNRMEKLSPLGAVSRLVQSSFIPHWDSKGMTFTLDLFADLAFTVPCHLLTFSPNKSALRFIEQQL